MATYYCEDETIATISAHNGTFFGNDELKELVGGPVDIIDMGEQGVLLIRADYYPIGIPENTKATELSRPYIQKDTYIAGPALHLTMKEIIDTPSWQKLE